MDSGWCQSQFVCALQSSFLFWFVSGAVTVSVGRVATFSTRCCTRLPENFRNSRHFQTMVPLPTIQLERSKWTLCQHFFGIIFRFCPARTCYQCDQVWRNFATLGNFKKSLANFSWLVFGKILNLDWQFCAIMLILFVVNGLIVKNWSSHQVTLPATLIEKRSTSDGHLFCLPFYSSSLDPTVINHLPVSLSLLTLYTQQNYT